MQNIKRENALGLIADAIEEELKNQPASIVDVDEVGATVGVFLDEYPNIHKNTTDRIEKFGWKWSGLTQDPDGTVNLYFRPVDE